MYIYGDVKIIFFLFLESCLKTLYYSRTHTFLAKKKIIVVFRRFLCGWIDIRHTLGRKLTNV